MKLNGAKYPVMMFGNKSPDISVSISSSCIEQSDKEKLLGITFAKTWTSIATLKIHAKNTGQQLHALARVAKFLDQEE